MLTLLFHSVDTDSGREQIKAESWGKTETERVRDGDIDTERLRDG